VTTLRELFPGARFVQAQQAFTHGAGIDEAGRLVTWGSNWAGQRGLGHLGAVDGPTIVDAAHRYVDVALGDAQTYALRDDGAVIGFGLELPALLDGPGGLPLGGGAGRAYPTPAELLPAGTGLVALEAGVEHLVALDREGVVKTFGCGSWGALGRGAASDPLAACVEFAMPAGIDCRREPGPVDGQQAPAVSIAALRAGTQFVERTGALRSVGANCFGPLGSDLWQPFPSAIEPRLPLRDPADGPRRFVEGASGALHHALTVTADGRLVGWGHDLGQLGGPRFGDVVLPREVAPPPGGKVLQLAAGFFHVVALGAEGRVFVAGLNQQGQLGLGEVDDWYRAGWLELDLAPHCAR